MPSRTERLSTFNLWNRKGHYYLGLYFLFFLWLFAFTGLLLSLGINGEIEWTAARPDSTVFDSA